MNLSFLEPFRRYVPLLVWIIVLLTLLVIPLKIIGYGYLPGDDALRAAAKAVSGKTWQEILVLDPVYKIDHEFGWSLLLAKLHGLFGGGPEAIMIFSVVFLFLLAGLAAVMWMRYPEAWLWILALTMVTVMMPYRMLLGRPFLITLAALIALLFFWRKQGSAQPKLWMAAVMTALISASVYLHGTWYLWVLPIAAFVLASQWRWALILTACWIGGVILGSLLTGHPIEYPLQAVKIVLLATGKHLTARTQAGELRPENGDMHAVFALAGILLLRRLANLKAPPLHRDPTFWLTCICWVLAFRVARFWMDWGWPALMVLIACDLQLLFASRIIFDSFRRLGLVVAAAGVCFLSITSDVNNRWTNTLTDQYLTADNPDLAGWLPDKGGIFYSTEMELFYQTFYKNPHGDWRYIIGFEPTLMPPEDFEVYHKILWNYGDCQAYTPWLLKMKLADRLVVHGSRGTYPGMPQLDWKYGVSGIWIGRLPGHTGGSPATVPATEPMSSLTNAPAKITPK